MDIQVYSSHDLAKLQQQEASLQQRDYRLVNKNSVKDLQPLEYIKNTFTGSESSFEGAQGHSLHWLE